MKGRRTRKRANLRRHCCYLGRGKREGGRKRRRTRMCPLYQRRRKTV
jgi:hypothetical protein